MNNGCCRGSYGIMLRVSSDDPHSIHDISYSCHNPKIASHNLIGLPRKAQNLEKLQSNMDASATQNKRLLKERTQTYNLILSYS